MSQEHNQNLNTPTTEERIWAILSHLSTLAFGIGILLPVIGWSEQRRKSKYASFQCLQALGYQSLGFTVWLLAYLLAFILMLAFVVVMSYGAERNNQTFDPFSSLVITMLLIVTFGSLAIYMLLPIIAATACAFGKDFHYPIMGIRLAKYLRAQQMEDESSSLIEAHEDHWVAAMGHISIILPLWGMLAPLTAWILQSKRSPFLKFQSIQTITYQALVNILYIAAGFLYVFGIIAIFTVTGLESNPDQSSPAGIMGLVILGLFMLLASVILLFVPLFHILGQWAGYRVLKGDHYHYPVVGKLVEKRIAMKTRSPRTAA